jgi:hypothetical protein
MTKTELIEQLKLTDEEIGRLLTAPGGEPSPDGIDWIFAEEIRGYGLEIVKHVVQAQLDKVFNNPDLYLYEPVGGDSFLFKNLHEISEMEIFNER